MVRGNFFWGRMPELPEVETVRRGLLPVMDGARIENVWIGRKDLRFPFPNKFVQRLQGAVVDHLGRRGKFLVASLSSGQTLIMHLGMTGRFTIEDAPSIGTDAFYYHQTQAEKHTHVVFSFARPSKKPSVVTYNDARRFGYMDLVPTKTLDESKHFAAMGPEPLDRSFDIAGFNERLKDRKSPIKQALLDQRVVAGLGNIYVCEALFRAKVSPRRSASAVAGRRGARLHAEIIEVLKEAIKAGGSTLRDFAASDGALGYFQHGFQVYDREGKECPCCGAAIKRIVQSGRSTFFCSNCQR